MIDYHPDLQCEIIKSYVAMFWKNNKTAYFSYCSSYSLNKVKYLKQPYDKNQIKLCKADPFQYITTNRQPPFIQESCNNVWTN